MRFKIKQYLIFAIFSNKNKFINVSVYDFFKYVTIPLQRIVVCITNQSSTSTYIWLDMSMGVRVTSTYGLRSLVHIREKWGHGEIGEDQGDMTTSRTDGQLLKPKHGTSDCHMEKGPPPCRFTLWEKPSNVKTWMKTHISNHLHESELSCRKVSSEIVLLGQKFKLPIANAGPSTLTRLQNHSKCRNDLEPRKPWGCEALIHSQHNTTSDN